MHAEHALKAMLDSAHVQTSQLEDVGSAHQAANVESLVDLRNQLEQTGERLTEEVLAREAASGEIARQLQREVDAREQVISAAADAAAAANRATQQVLRTEIRARMKGEASLSTQQKAAAVEAANAMAQVQSSLDEEAMATKKRFAVISRDLAVHKGRTEADLALANERHESVSNRQASALAALHREHQNLIKATRAAMASLKASAEGRLDQSEKRRISEVARVQQEVSEELARQHEAVHARIDQAEVTFASQLEATIQSFAEERQQREQAIAKMIQTHAVQRQADIEAMAAAQQTTSARIDALVARLDADETNLATTASELRSMDARIDSAARVAADELQKQINALGKDKEALASQLEAQADMIIVERSTRSAAVLSCAEAAAEQLFAHSKEAAMATSAVRSELTRADEAQKVALSDLQFKTQHNMLRLQEGLQRSEEHSEEGLRLLEQHCAHQLQHGLDALGANLEHLIEQGVEVEAMARTNAYNQLAAQVRVRVGVRVRVRARIRANPNPNPNPDPDPNLTLTLTRPPRSTTPSRRSASILALPRPAQSRRCASRSYTSPSQPTLSLTLAT